MLINTFKNSKFLGAILIILLGCIILYPSIDFQPRLSQGDHGRDLYAFSVTDQGDVVYQDYWWVYGPLMPYYYSIFENILGTTIPSILIGQALLILLSGLFFYLILTTIISLELSVIGGLWFLLFKPSFFFTYNHAGGITLTLITVYCSFLYLNNQKNKYLAWGLLCAFLLCLVKVNFGVTALIFLLLATFVTDHVNKVSFNPGKILFYIISLVAFPIIIFLIYYFLTSDLPTYVIRQCLPYLSVDHPYNLSFSNSLRILLNAIYANITGGTINLFFGILIWISTGVLISFLITKKFDKHEQSKIISAIVFLIFFYILNLHEYLSSGVFYRSFWAKPFSFLLIFIIIGSATSRLHLFIRSLLYGTLALILLLLGINQFNYIRHVKSPSQYLNLDRGKVYLGNSPQWISTVAQTVYFLKNNMKDSESFFALPYDTLYYYLMNQKTPTRQLIFFDHINIPEEQEQRIIKDLEKNNVNWIVLSNRFSSKEQGLGTLGITYCPIIGKYLDDNFVLVAQIGDWANPPGWATNHGTRILKRKN